jgi:hypothetical protein
VGGGQCEVATGIPTAIIAEPYRAGELMDCSDRITGAIADEIEEAIRHESQAA